MKPVIIIAIAFVLLIPIPIFAQVVDFNIDQEVYYQFPMITSLSILNHVDMDSEIEVLGYSISLIVLNGMMYVGIPAIIILRIRK